MSATTYREQFSRQEKASEYEANYQRRTYDTVLWEVEQSQLRRVIADLRTTHERITYLDFAAGTGRVISFVESLVDEARGIEISESMAAIAREKLERGEMVVKDITAEPDDAEPEAKYDLITAFRFILNAEPTLRRNAMRRLTARLRDESSIIVFNNHGALCSHKALLWPFHAIKRMGKGYLSEGNYLSHRQVQRIADEAGLEIIGRFGCGVLSNKYMRFAGYEKTLAREQKLAQGRFWQKFGVNQLYIARKQRARG